jgi:hypothetical protein
MRSMIRLRARSEACGTVVVGVTSFDKWKNFREDLLSKAAISYTLRHAATRVRITFWSGFLYGVTAALFSFAAANRD